ncbi:MAG: hypothetical protein H7Y11_11975, partial [Armatimonadetes bacterium]|nr:hypothetical protein [Anaerolineae bacterium]
MPSAYTSSYQIRHAECDPHGRLGVAGLLVYLQDAAFGASAAVGYTAARYAKLGYHWFAYETQLTLLHPLRYEQTVTVKTWIADFRRVRSLRCYEVTREGVLVAYGTTDWVFISAKTRGPISIPPEVVAAYAEHTPTDVTPPPPVNFPPFPLGLPSEAYAMQHRVEWRDLDPAVHVNNAVYADYALEAQRRGDAEAGMVVTPWVQRLHIEYKLAAHLDDVLTVTTWATAA